MPGGGVAYLRSISKLDDLKLKGDEKIGAVIVKRALEEPIRQIIRNAGLEDSVVVNEVKGKGKNEGFNAQSEEYVDMISAGIIDPTKVSRSALENAASVAGLLLMTETLVSDIPEEEKPGPAMPPGGGMPGGMGGMY